LHLPSSDTTSCSMLSRSSQSPASTWRSRSSSCVPVSGRRASLAAEARVDPAPAGERHDQRVGALLPVALFSGRLVELLWECCAWKMEANASALGEGDAQVLQEVVDLETRLEIAAQNPGRVVRQRPRSRRAAGDRVERPLEVEAGGVGVEERFADADHPGGDRDLVRHLRVLPGTGTALE